MIKNVLDKCMSGLDIDSGDLVGFYSFREFSGEVVFNEKLGNPNVDSFEGDNLKSDTYPLYNLCQDKDPTNNPSGSGYFDGDTILQVGPHFPFKDYTVMFEYETDDFDHDYNIGRTLFSSMDGCNSASGFNFGFNGAQKPYLEYVNKDGHKKILTLECELGKRNVLSFSRNSESDTFNISHHDELYGNHLSQTFYSNKTKSGITDLSYSDSLYMGDFFQTGQEGYTGFSGYLNNVLVFSKPLTEKERGTISKCILASDYTANQFVEETYLKEQITGEVVTTTGVIRTGITGYEQVFSGTITTDERCASDTINVYSQSGVTGEITGLIYNYETGITLVTGYRAVFVDEIVTLDNNRVLEFKRDNLVHFKPHDAAIDYSELYLFSGIETGINKKTSTINNLNAFGLGMTLASDHQIEIWNNGLHQRSGEVDANGSITADYYLSGNQYAISKTSVNDENTPDVAVFDLVDSSHTYLTYEHGVSATEYSDSSYLNRDLYLSGQKLFSGTDWRIQVNGSDESVIIMKDITGDIAFIPRLDFNQRYEDNDTSLFETTGIGNEVLWFNGQRLLRQKDYLIISENSLLSTGEYVRRKDNFSLYNGGLEGVQYS